MGCVPFIRPLRNRNVAGDFHRPYGTLNVMDFTIHRTTLPQSRPFGRASSLREGAGNGCIPFNRPPGSRNVAGDFHRPYGTLNVMDFTIHRTTLPQSRPFGRASSLREGAGNGCIPFNRPPGSRNVAGDFHRPYGTLNVMDFTIHRTTLPQSRPFGRASSLREGAGNGCAIHPTARKPERCGRFSSPLRNSEYLTAQKLPVSDAKTIPGGAGHLPYGNPPKA